MSALMAEYPPTPVLTKHAKERCAEMGIKTKVAKRIVQCADIRRPGNIDTDCLVAVCDDHPEYAVVYEPRDGEPDVIVTVVFRTCEDYVRNGATFEVID